MNEIKTDPVEEPLTRAQRAWFRYHYGENFEKINTSLPCWREELTGTPRMPPILISLDIKSEDKKSPSI